MTGPVPKKLRQQFADTMLDVGTADPDLVVLIGDITHFMLQPFAQACPGRFFNVGICEPTIVSMGAGLAKAGLYPVMHTIAPFLIERSFEQINSAKITDMSKVCKIIYRRSAGIQTHLWRILGNKIFNFF